MNRYLIFGFIFFAILIFTFSSCVKKDPACNISGGKYEFVLPFRLSPAQETFHIGDTITISSMMSDKIYDRITNNYYSLKDFKFYLTTTIFYMDTSKIDYYNFNMFDLVIDSIYWYNIFLFSDGNSHLQTDFLYLNNEYKIEYKIIPKVSGHFLLGQWSQLNLINENQEFAWKCKNIEDDAKVYMNGWNDNNITLIYDAENSYYEEFIKHKNEKYLDLGGYCFKVID